MKRTELKPGKPLERRTSLMRSAGPRVSSSKSTTGGKPKRYGGKDGAPGKKSAAARRFRKLIVVGPCAMCAEFPPSLRERHVFYPQIARLDAHHLIREQTLRAEGHGPHIYDARNGFCICRFHHDRHHSHELRIPRSLLPAAVFEFAAELGLEAILDREYPVVEQHPLNIAIEEAA